MPEDVSSPEPVVSILIVTWNSAGVIGGCLDSIRDKAGDTALEVILVDNHSSDDTAGAVDREYPWVHLIRTGRNLGFARAMNLAAAEARGRYIFLLNPDAGLENDAVSILTEFLESHPEAGAASPDILEADGERALAAIQTRPTLLSQFLYQFGLKRLFGGRPGKSLGAVPDQGDRLSGSAMMIPARAWQDKGGLNEELPLYFEDLDLSTRIERAGMELWRVPAARVTHLGEASAEVFSRRRMLLAMENGQAPHMYFGLYKGPWAAVLFTLIIFCGSVFRLTLVRTVGWLALIRGARGKDWRKRIVQNASALLRWSWGSKKDFMIRVQTHFYGREEAEPIPDEVVGSIPEGPAEPELRGVPEVDPAESEEHTGGGEQTGVDDPKDGP